jgi:hypothetical protein
MPGFEIEDDVIIERLGKIFKDMPPYTLFPVQSTPRHGHQTRLVVVARAPEY